jgi:hypothetical protein
MHEETNGRYLSLTESARTCEMGRTTLYHHILKGRIPTVTRDRCLFIRESDLWAFIRRYRAGEYPMGRPMARWDRVADKVTA